MFTIDFGNPFGGETLTCDVKIEPAPPTDVASAKVEQAPAAHEASADVKAEQAPAGHAASAKE